MTGAACSHPLDLIKVRMQLQGEIAAVLNPRAVTKKIGVREMASSIVQQDGFKGLFRGCSASLFRQFLYSGSRFGFYDMFKTEAHKYHVCDGPLPLYAKIGTAMAAGALGAYIANPGDVAMVRMQADGRRAPAERRNYKHIFDAIRRIAQEEGPSRLWRGAGPTVNRAMIVTVGHLAAYDEVKQRLLATGHFAENIGLHFASSFSAAFIASALSHPVDVSKTRLMNMANNEYKGMLDCLMKTVHNEGPFALYKGFGATLMRQMPYVIVTWMTVEQVKHFFATHDI